MNQKVEGATAELTEKSRKLRASFVRWTVATIVLVALVAGGWVTVAYELTVLHTPGIWMHVIGMIGSTFAPVAVAWAAFRAFKRYEDSRR